MTTDTEDRRRVPPPALALILTWSLLVAGAVTPGGARAQTVAFTPVTVVDVREGVALPDRTVVVTNDRIAAVGREGSVQVPSSARLVDGTGKYLIPGLWDMHAHTTTDRNTREVIFPLLVAHGITGIRSMAADCFETGEPNCEEEGSSATLATIEDVRRWRREMATGTLVGPQVVAGSYYVNSPGPGETSTPQYPGTAEHGREHARLLHERGVDFIKVYSMLSREAYFALADEANRLGLPFAGHVPVAVRASEASDAGQASIEHLGAGNVLEECSSREDELRARIIAEFNRGGEGSRHDEDGPAILPLMLEMVDTHDPGKCAALADRFVRNSTWVVPTLMIARLPSELGRGWREDPYARFLPPDERRYFEWAEETYSRDLGDAEERAPYSRWVREVTGTMHREGVRMLAGTDAGETGIFWGIGLHQELELLVDAGLTEAEALRAATLGPAEFLEATDSLGTVEAGKLADLVLLDANPLEAIKNTQKIRAVVLRGQYLDREALDQLLASAEQAASRPQEAAPDGGSDKDRSPAGELQSDTVYVAPPKGKQETDRASILAALEEVEPGGTIQFAPGIYLVGEIIPVPQSGITLQAHPNGTTLRGCELGGPPASFSSCGVIVLTGGWVTLRGFTIEQTQLGICISACGYDIQAPVGDTVGGYRIEDNTFRNSLNAIRGQVVSSDTTVIRNNRFINTFHAVGIQEASHLHVVDNRVSAPDPEQVPGIGHLSFAIAVAGGPNLIARNYIEGHPEGILVTAFPGDTASGNVIRENTIVVARNRLPDGGSRALTNSDPADSTIVGVPLLLNAWITLGDSTETGRVSNNLVEENRILGAEGVGIELGRGSSNRIVGNEVAGIVPRRPFPGNTVSTNPEPWHDANGSGIWVSPGSDGNEIVGNTFEDIAAAAVVVEGDRNRVVLANPEDEVRDLGRGNRIVGVQDAEVPRTRIFPGLEEAPYPYVQPQMVGLSAERLEELGDRVAGWVQDSSIVGAEILVVKDRKIVLHEAIGWSDREAVDPMRRNTIYRIRSMTKPFTGTAALLLVEEGKLTLDAPVARWLPSWDNERSGEITVRQLLTHTAGWVQGGLPEPLRSYPHLRAAVAAAGEAGPQHPPGEALRYSDVHSYTLGALVAEVSGMPVERFIEDRILGPLGLGDTHTLFAPDTTWADRMNPTYRREDSVWEQYWHPDSAQVAHFFRASGGLYSTVFDYARWMDAWMQWAGLVDAPEEGRTPPRLLSEAIAQEALAPSQLGSYGFHWDIESLDPLVFGHGGSDGTLAMAIPSRNTMVFYFTQSRGNETRGDWSHAALGAAAPDLQLKRPVLAVPAAKAGLAPVQVRARELERYAGAYAFFGDTLTFAVERGRLRGRELPRPLVTLDGRPVRLFTLVPLGDRTFAFGRYEDGELVEVYLPQQRLRFEVEEGEVVGLRPSRRGDAGPLVPKIR